MSFSIKILNCQREAKSALNQAELTPKINTYHKNTYIGTSTNTESLISKLILDCDQINIQG